MADNLICIPDSNTMVDFLEHQIEKEPPVGAYCRVVKTKTHWYEVVEEIGVLSYDCSDYANIRNVKGTTEWRLMTLPQNCVSPLELVRIVESNQAAYLVPDWFTQTSQSGDLIQLAVMGLDPDDPCLKEGAKCKLLFAKAPHGPIRRDYVLKVMPGH